MDGYGDVYLLQSNVELAILRQKLWWILQKYEWHVGVWWQFHNDPTRHTANLRAKIATWALVTFPFMGGSYFCDGCYFYFLSRACVFFLIISRAAWQELSTVVAASWFCPQLQVVNSSFIWMPSNLDFRQQSITDHSRWGWWSLGRWIRN